ncbi:MAG: hypothetical protein J2P36_28545, partial [Ktedonobacteraceae bacterium]|nr:hypothetical protein [Ktedonobacteraceae bacterium]
CVERLKRFRPTKVALEVTVSRDSALNEDYRCYKEGTFSLSADEMHQIGFRLAAELGHERVYTIDWHNLQRPIGWEDAINFAREHHQSGRLDALYAQMEHNTDEASANVTAISVLDLLRGANEPSNLLANHIVYMEMARIGERDNYIGADVILRWYERNMKIFVNLTRILNSQEDRVLVIIGSGHIYLLKHFIEGSDLYTLEPTGAYLG